MRSSHRDLTSRSADQSGRATPRGPGMGSLKGQRSRGELMNSKSVDYSHHHGGGAGGGRGMTAAQAKRMRSKSTDQLHTEGGSSRGSNGNCRIDSGTLKKMLKPVHTAPESPVTSPEGGRNRRIMMMGSSADTRMNGHGGGHGKHNGYMGSGGGQGGGGGPHRGNSGQYDSDRDGFMSEPESSSRLRAARAGMGKQPPPQNMYHRDIGRPSTGNNALHKNSGGRNLNRGQLYLDFNDRQNAASPPSDSGN